MELVPILSTIILVGTIATFILAVAAYILYKIRERRVRDEPSAARPASTEPHVLVTPRPPEPVPEPEPVREAPSTGRGPSMFWEYTDRGFVPVDPPVAQESGRPDEGERRPNGGPAWL